jgi:hypothetical protein
LGFHPCRTVCHRCALHDNEGGVLILLSRDSITPHDIFVRFSIFFLCTIALFLSIISLSLVPKNSDFANVTIVFFALFFWGYGILFADILAYFFGERIQNFIKKTWNNLFQTYEKFEIWFKIGFLFIGYFCFMAIARFVFMGNQQYLESVFQIGQLGFLAFISFAAKEIYDEYKRRKSQLKTD